MPQQASSPAKRRSYLVECSIAVVGLTVAIVVHSLIRHWEGDARDAHFRASASNRLLQIEQAFSRQATAVFSLASFLDNDAPADYSRFETAIDNATRQDRDVAIAYWVPIVRSEAGPPMVTDVASEAETDDPELPDEEELTPRVLELNPGDSLPIQFAYPEGDPVAAEGYDFAESTPVRAAMRRALMGPRPAWTQPMEWEGEMTYFVIREVVEDRGAPVEPREQRTDALGFVLLAIPIRDTILEAFENDPNDEVSIRALSMSRSGQVRFAWTYDADTKQVVFEEVDGNQAMSSDPSDIDRTLRMAGNRLKTFATPGAAFMEERTGYTSWLALLLGIGLTIVGVIHSHSILDRKVFVEQLVDQRTRELKQANDSMELHMHERERAELALRLSEYRFRSLVENASDLIWELDTDGCFTYVSPQVETLLGYSPDAVLGKKFCDLLVEEQRPSVRESFCDAAAEAAPVITAENSFLHASGETVLMETNAALIKDGQGELLGFRGITRDITERIEAERKLAYERFLLNTLLEHSPDFIYFKDTDSHFIRISQALAEYYGLDSARLAVGKTDFDIFYADNASQYLKDERRVMATGEPIVNKEEKQVAPDGRVLWMSTTKVCLRDPDGTVVGTFGISRDVTTQRKAADALQRAKEEAENVSRAKSTFLANMSHEIRTPMNAVIGMTELLLETDLSSSQHEYLTMVLESGESLLCILNDILDFSKIEAGKLDLECVQFELREILGDTLKALAFRAHAKGLELLCSIASDVPELLCGDDERLKQIVINLVSNAVKFTQTGEVILSVQLKNLVENKAQLLFTISDTGVGIPQEKLAKIFEAFEQADASTKRNFGGTGLGLAICAQLCHLMGGRIWAESTSNVGSQFHFEIPFEMVAGAKSIRPPAGIPGRRILVVDDSVNNCEIMSEMLKSWEMTPLNAETPQRAWDIVRGQQQESKPVDVALIDARIGRADGFSLAQQIKGDQALSTRVIMLLTSGDRPAEIARCEKLGIANYLLKPVKRSELFDAIVTVLDLSVVAIEAGEATDADEEPSLPPLNILLAEDNMVNQRLALGLLRRRGHTLVVADNGRKAVDEYKRQAFDVVLMDVEMPEMDGFEATQAIRDLEATSGTHIPIIAMTAHAMKGDRERCLERGMDGYVPKPVRAKSLFTTLRDVLQRLHHQA